MIALALAGLGLTAAEDIDSEATIRAYCANAAVTPLTQWQQCFQR
jgi:hypothetical protein